MPENPASPNGRHINLRVVVVPASGPHRAADPLFYFAGGPGGAASDSVRWAATTFRAFNEAHDLVFVDQRGTGGSNAMNCPELMNIGGGEFGVVPSASAEVSAAKTCLAASARTGDPRMYTTPLFADDVDRVRAALGDVSIDIYGGSYGVSSGLTYIQRHGAHVRAALLDSGSLLDVPLWQLSAVSQASALQSVLNRCAADASCHSAYPRIQTMLTTILDRLSAAPVTFTVTDPRSRATVPVTVNPLGFVSVLASFLDTAQDQAQLPAFIFTAYLGQWPYLAQQLLASAPTTNPTDTLVAAQTVKCSDAWARMDPASARAAGGSSIFTGFVVERAVLSGAFCTAWPEAIGASGQVRSAAPIVFLNGTADPADPPANVAGAAATMPNSLSVQVQGYGHGQLSQDTSGCLTREAIAFLERGVGSTPADWPCAADPPFPPFSLG
ncbi:MAG: alpha/beta hydrolase [Candidatus Dormibacteria bacterium]